MTKRYEESELIVNSDGSVFHLHLKPDEIGDYVVLAGDPARIDLIAGHFDEVITRKSNREFYSITGIAGNKKITALSTGIGTDNIDIVLNEIDALANIDLNERIDQAKKKSIRFIRIGTSGSIREDIEPGTSVVSQYSIGFDGLMNFYPRRAELMNSELEKQFKSHTEWPATLGNPYALDAHHDMLRVFGQGHLPGVTISAHGFYAPQGRALRGGLAYPDLFNKLPSFSFKGCPLTNFEMECSALYGLSKMLGHQAITICLIIANRQKKRFVGDYQKLMNQLISKIIGDIKND